MISESHDFRSHDSYRMSITAMDIPTGCQSQLWIFLQDVNHSYGYSYRMSITAMDIPTGCQSQLWIFLQDVNHSYGYSYRMSITAMDIPTGCEERLDLCKFLIKAT